MQIKKIILLLAMGTMLMAAEPTNRAGDPDYASGLFKSMFPNSGVTEHVLWDGNNISTVHGNHGDVSSYHVTGSSGTEWPKGSGKFVIFQSGLWMISAKSRPNDPSLSDEDDGNSPWEDDVRSAASEYSAEFVPGNMSGTSDGHIYQIHRAELDAFLENDYATYSVMSASLPITKIDGANIFTEPATKSFPTSDFENWPAEDGAPWIDANGDGVYNIQDGDYPDILGDMFHWYVMNDGDAATHQNLWGTVPMGVEVQTSVFGFNQAGALGNIMFVRWVAINKGTDDLDSVYVSMWHDDDVGDASDDLVGCDTLLSVGYTYNAGADMLYGAAVPAAGADFFQGPLVASEGDTASILTWSQDSSYYVRTVNGKKRLGLTSFAKYTNSDPSAGDPETAEEALNYMNGRNGESGEEFVDPGTGAPTLFRHAGDPVTGAGDLDNTEGDRRYMMTSGPFTFNVGDTAEVVGSIIIAASGDWQKSITKMKYYDNFAQGAFDANFNVCSPPAPEIVISQMDRKVVLSFEEIAEKVEEYSCAGYGFQGNNIYQGESAVGPWKRITTYDLVDDIKLIIDQGLDDETGELLEFPSQFGTDTGIDHFIEIDQDYVDGGLLINYREYYFAVTAYAYDPNAAKRVIESPIYSYTAIPSPPGVGTDLAIGNNENIEYTHTAGTAGTSIYPNVIDPYLLTGELYSVTVEEADSTRSKWVLSSGGEVVAEDTLFPITQDYFTTLKDANGGIDPDGVYINNTITDGFILTFQDGLWDVNNYSSATEIVADTANSALAFSGLGSGGFSAWADYMNFLFDAYGANAGFSPANGVPTVDDKQRDLELRFTDGGSIASYANIQTLRGNMDPDTIMIPFELWDVENGEERQINVLTYQVAGASKPSSLVEGALYNDDTTATHWAFSANFQYIPVYTDYEASSVSPIHPQNNADITGWVLNFDRNNTVWQGGDQIQIVFDNPLVQGVDKYEFTPTGTMASADATLDIEKINVFPNPYFGQNPEESNPQGRMVYFTHLGVGTSTIRIYTISGDLVTRFDHSVESENASGGNRAVWDLRNSNGIPVASGVYIVYITVSDENGSAIGEKIMKLAIFQPEERLDLF